jgi:hypothetical protein
METLEDLVGTRLLNRPITLRHYRRIQAAGSKRGGRRRTSRA